MRTSSQHQNFQFKCALASLAIHVDSEARQAMSPSRAAQMDINRIGWHYRPELTCDFHDAVYPAPMTPTIDLEGSASRVKAEQHQQRFLRGIRGPAGCEPRARRYRTLFPHIDSFHGRITVRALLEAFFSGLSGSLKGSRATPRYC